MHHNSILRIIGFYIIIFGLTLITPILVALWYGESELMHFFIPMVTSLSSGALLLSFRKRRSENLSTRDGFLIVALFWILLSLLGAFPLMLSAHLSFIDAVFESASGVTTTGATVMTGLDSLPRSLLFYRQQLQWIGGMGLVVLGVAVLPMLGIGGMQLYRAEAPGPMKEEKLTPRLAVTARYFWSIYVGLTALCALCFWIAGMEPFDAIAHSLSTLSTGGFSTHDASIGYFNSPFIEGVAIFFMVIAAINFGVHFIALNKRNPMQYFHDVESRSFILINIGLVLLVASILTLEISDYTLIKGLRDSAFIVVSVITSTGFGTVDFSHWPDFLPVLLIFISFIGGCGGSTAGGMKVMRILLLVKQGLHEAKKLIHPQAILPVRLGNRLIDNRLMQGVWGFFSLYIAAFIVLMLLMMHAGLDALSAFAAIATAMNNMGPGLGEVAYNFQSVSGFGKLIATAAMLLGRLEIFTLLVLLTPGFWRQ